LGLTRLGRFGPEAVGKGLVFGDFLLLARDLTFLSPALLDLGGRERRVIPRVEGDRLVVDVEDVSADVVEEAMEART
jgi:hypothetical protein